MLRTLWQTFSLGPFNLPLLVIPLALTWLFYKLSTGRIYREDSARLEQTDRILFNAILLGIVVWKVSPLVFRFKTVMANPIALLYLPGGSPGLILGVAAAAIYTLLAVRRQKKNRPGLIKSLMINTVLLAGLLLVLSLMTGFILEKFPGESPVSSQAIGQPAPEFSLVAEDGRTYSLTDYQGQTVVINFWATWCPPCRAELPELKAFHDSLGRGETAADTVFLSINLYTSEKEPESIPAFLEEHEITFPVLYDKTGEIATAYGVESIPTTVIIDREGNLQEVRRGAVSESVLNRLVGAGKE